MAILKPSQAERQDFPGLRPDEAAVLRLWLALHEDEYDRFDYNVRVGPGTPAAPDVEAAIARGWLLSTQLRIDAVGWQGNTPTLIEVKARARPSAIGQLMVYAHHFPAAFPSAPKPLLLVIAYTAIAGVPEAMAAAGIRFEQVLPAT